MGNSALGRMSYAKLTSACLTGLLPVMKGHEHGDTLFDDDNWQSPQPLKQLEPLLDVSDGVSALNKSARVWFRLPTHHCSVSLKAANAISVQETQDQFAVPQVNESLRDCLIVLIGLGDVHFINILSEILTDHFKTYPLSVSFHWMAYCEDSQQSHWEISRVPCAFLSFNE